MYIEINSGAALSRDEESYARVMPVVSYQSLDNEVKVVTLTGGPDTVVASEPA